jgi:hypothetical protein
MTKEGGQRKRDENKGVIVVVVDDDEILSLSLSLSIYIEDKGWDGMGVLRFSSRRGTLLHPVLR